jgi:hypothetical protein
MPAETCRDSFQESSKNSSTRRAEAFVTHSSHIGIKEDAMLRVHEFTPFGTPNRVTAPEPPSAALAGVSWTQTNADPFFVDIDPTEMGYRTAPKGFTDTGARRPERGQRRIAFPTLSLAAVGRALHRFAAGRQHFAGA